MESKTCKTCKWWGSTHDRDHSSVKDCTHKEMNRMRPGKQSCCSRAARFAERRKGHSGKDYLSLTVMTDDGHGCIDVLTQRTGADFGCIHHEPTPPEPHNEQG